MTLVKRLILAFTAVVAVGLIATVVTSLSLGSFSGNDQNVTESHAAVIAVYETQMALSRQNTLLVTYITTAERKYRDEFDRQAIGFDHALDPALILVGGHAETRQNIEQLNGLMKQWLESAGKSMRFMSELVETRNLRAKITEQAGRAVAALNESIAEHYFGRV
ncbi:CHASE3 domain-containing protein [Bradyrhizobium sp. 4]|uniref:CHASE3 domain-containing protein n=2 Tax=Bradyrhizobium TaxID=374 RepID=UPI001FFA9F4F|nr:MULTISPECIES: CHASE3 domain-containing protein [unclassified Bradyrhizobium]MCK1396981.1 CHASE3 domain-containing protein [Bradyrhizobium sp. 39]MCK1752257.1 CHASE3 domain-containing protein [Bradyrhizobium sp. 135]UPJ36357.1 CHASE3 domain-containing protein [Bradyrhizobium sp. 4]